LGLLKTSGKQAQAKQASTVSEDEDVKAILRHSLVLHVRRVVTQIWDAMIGNILVLSLVCGRAKHLKSLLQKALGSSSFESQLVIDDIKS
jgi:hypothetical protein